ncbi:amino acid adenylation domain-containing protein [Streptomyces genisteinicus]|uniref:Amino acid adenylation domain-containing protein n=1 Tax=Streptomyces genisteinicus TaxID=2768068 RepID=A0A7H0HUM3_9ACTN|nr:amino acid adenylation domain-containing protein [Streptomyces genisteinicus]QNP64239.1 amino acid adenylation domain-containing protein [Streptomyces genisteinicus]
MTELRGSTGRTPPLAHELFEATRALHPDLPAVLHGERHLSYEELGRDSDRLARALRAAGVTGQPVGVFFERGPAIAVAVLGVLKAGCAYVPLDPAYPAERLAAMVRDSGARIVLADKASADRLPATDGACVTLLDDLLSVASSLADDEPAAPAPAVGPDALAYVIYTSGSTGVPKGVAMPHGPLANLVDWQCRVSPSGPGDRTLQFSALSFDVSFQELFSTWASGGTLVVADDGTRRSWQALIDLMNRASVRRVFLPFVALQAVAEHAVAVGAWPAALREVVTAGEQLQVTPSVRALFRHLDGAVLVNQYGPSETHVVTSLELGGDPDDWPDQPSIGRPIANAEAYIVDERLRPQPPGTPGELCIGGPVLAQGYLGMAEATGARFLTVPHLASAGRIYRTGDLVELLPDDTIRFLGRLDDQVKIRGHRVEIGEVEAHLRRLPELADAAVVVRQGPSGVKQLAAFCVPSRDAEVVPAAVRRSLAVHLPDHMVPSSVRSVPALPLTPSGKVDRKALAKRL